MKQQKLLIIGFGNQAKSWGLNLRDSGREVVYALRPNSPSHQIANAIGFETIDLQSEEISEFNLIALLTPDHTHVQILEEAKPLLNKKHKIILAHGYSYKYLKDISLEEWELLLLAPKAIASELRFQYETKGSLGAVFSVEASPTDDNTSAIKSLAKDLGINVGPFKSSFTQETNADLFSEQAILCSLIPYASSLCFDMLRKNDIPKELAYFETWYEVKLIVDTLMKIGPDKFFDLISPNALIGSQKAKELIFDESFKNKMDRLLSEIISEKFRDEVDQTNIFTLKESVNDFWSKQEITKVHNEFKDQLYR